MEADVTVSIVNHESRYAVLEALAELVADGGRRSRVQTIVVDNASQDGSAQAIRVAFPEVELIARETRAGYGANHNLALERAEGRYVLLLNDDARVRPGAIDALAAHLDAHPEVAIAAPTLVDGRGRALDSLWPAPTPAEEVRAALRLGRPRAAVRNGRPTAPVGWAMGAALMVRRDLARAAGGFDEGYFMYSEEIDLCVRLAASGGATAWVPAAEVVHEGQGTTGDSPERAIEMSRSRRRFQRRHYSPAGRVVASAAVSFQFALLALATRLRGRSGRVFWLQAVGAWREPGGAGLRERAAAFDAERAAGRAGDASRT